MIDLGPASSNPDAAPISSDTEIGVSRRCWTLRHGRRFPSRSTVINPRRKPMPCRLWCGYLNDIRGFQTLRSIRNWRNHLPNSSLCIRCKTGEADRREAPAGVMDHIAAFFDARRVAAYDGCGIKRNCLVLDPGMGVFLGCSETRSRLLARSMNCVRFHSQMFW